jgi:hypothetical protein
VTSIEKRLPQGIDRPCGENAARSNHPLKRKFAFARSARTQRSFRSKRLIPGRVVGKYGLVGKLHLVRADSVKHATSPSRHNISQRVIHVASDLNLSPLLPNTEMSSAATPRTSVRLVPSGLTQVQPACRLRVPHPLPWSGASFPRSKRLSRLREIWTQDSRSHIAMSYEPSIAWKASLRAHRRRFARPLSVLRPRWP